MTLQCEKLGAKSVWEGYVVPSPECSVVCGQNQEV